MSEIQFRDISVSEYRKPSVIISAEIQEAAVSKFMRLQDLTALKLEYELRKLGVGDAAYRGADRLMQRLRKAGVIKHVGGGKWRRIHGE